MDGKIFSAEMHTTFLCLFRWKHGRTNMLKEFCFSIFSVMQKQAIKVVYYNNRMIIIIFFQVSMVC